MELKFNVDIKSVIPENISFNYEELDAELTQMLSKYSGTKVTEENFGECKSVRAKINKVSKSFKDERTSIKKRMLEPIEDFSTKIDLLVGKCNMVSGFIDEGIKRIENERKELKRAELVSYMNGELERVASVLGDDITHSPCFKAWFDMQNFLNATVSMDNAKLAILAKIHAVKDDVAVLRATYPDLDEFIRATIYYANNFNLATTIADVTKEREDCKRVEQIKSAQVADPLVPQTKQFGDPIYETTLKVVGTKKQLKNLADFLNCYGIKFEVISKTVEVK